MRLKLVSGETILLDRKDWCWARRCRWRALRTGRMVYAMCDAHTLMHRKIMRASPGERVDHRNHNGLDNRRENLRWATVSQNGGNSRQHVDAGHSKHKGVTWDRTNHKWVARIQCQKKRVSLGSFSTERRAAIAYEAAAKRFFHEFSHI